MYNKPTSLKTLLKECNIDVAIISETWERAEPNLESLLCLSSYITISKKRPGDNVGGGVAVIINSGYSRTEPDLSAPAGVEVIWTVLQPPNDPTKKIAVAAVYVPPRSRKKAETIEFLISSYFLLLSKFDKIQFIIGGDFNNLDIKPLTDAAPSLKQVVDKPTHNNRVLDVIITDMKELYYPPFVKPPLENDDDLQGEPSDHNTVFLIPNSLNINSSLPEKKRICTRPLLQSGIQDFGRFITTHNWSEVLLEKDVNKKTVAFHKTIREQYENIFPEKITEFSPLDKPWMTPQIKKVHRRMKREYWKNKKSDKWRTLKRQFSKMKKTQSTNMFAELLETTKNQGGSHLFKTCRKMGLIKNSNYGGLRVECLEGLMKEEAADRVATHFAAISQGYQPLDRTALPAYLPSPQPPVLQEYQVYLELRKMKRTKSVLPTDIPYKLRQEFAVELATPLTNIFNACLESGIYPDVWKFECITPVPKVQSPKIIKDLRKISCTSDYSKLFERFLKNWILEDITPKLDPAQFGNQKGTGTDHLLVALVDRILRYLDQNLNSPAVIATMLDWSAAFDRQCPTIGIKRFIELGVRPAIVHVLTSYLSNRTMSVKLNGAYSGVHSMPGGGPQGTLLGVLEYLVQCNNNADCVDEDLRFKYVDDLTVLELISLSILSHGLSSYNVKHQIPSDIGVDHLFIPAGSLRTQSYINSIAQWTEENRMLLNVEKSNYMVITRATGGYSTRLQLNHNNLERVQAVKLLGVWVTDTVDWEINTKEICRKAYTRISLLSKLKYVGMKVEDLLTVYTTYIRCLTEYCCVVWNSSLTAQQKTAIERIQKVCLKIILGNDYGEYETALQHCKLESLEARRDKLSLSFARKCVSSSKHRHLFPLAVRDHDHQLRHQELYHVNPARTEKYRKSAVPYLQRKLNQDI